MKEFVSAVVVAIVLAVGATFAWLDRSTANVEQTRLGNVRL